MQQENTKLLGNRNKKKYFNSIMLLPAKQSLQVCDSFEVKLVTPEPKYCTDNGVMIAWNGLEKWRRQMDIVHPSQVFSPCMSISPRAPFGEDISDEIKSASIKCKWIKEAEIVQKFVNKVAA